MNKKLVDEIVAQIKNEFFSSQLYLTMGVYAANNEYLGFKAWFLNQAEEERQHAFKFIEYLLSRGEKVEILGFENPKNDYKSIEETLEFALQHEKFVTSKINLLMNIAQEDKDYPSINLLNWYIDEQVEEESTFGTLLTKVKRLEGNKMGLYQLDKELGGSVPVSAEASAQ